MAAPRDPRRATVRYRTDGGGPWGGRLVESLFCKLNLEAGRALWLKITFLARGQGGKGDVCEAWAIAFDGGADAEPEHVAIRQTWPASEARCGGQQLDVQVATVTLRGGRAQGELLGTEGERIQWDLRFPTGGASFEHLPAAWMYEAAFPRSKACSPWVDALFTGTVEITPAGPSARPRRWKVDGAPGMLGHNWGASHARAWTWAHCNAWAGAHGVVFEGVTAKIPLGPLTSPWLTTVFVQLPGECFSLSTLNPRHRVRSRAEGLDWSVDARGGGRRVSARFHAPVDRFVGVDYEDPDGAIAHCLNTKIGRGELSVFGRAARGWAPLLAATCHRSAALEVGRRDTTHGVEIRIP